MEKIRIGVLMGGKSLEREVSFNSGRTICDHLDPHCFNIIPLFQTPYNQLFILPWHFLYRGKIADFENRLTQDAQYIAWANLKTIVDFVYIAQHGRFAEDGTLQGFLEILGVPYHGSKVFSSALGMDKIIQKNFLSAVGIQVPSHVEVSKYGYLQEEILQDMHKKEIKFPCIIKPRKEGSSFGVFCAHNENELWNFIEQAREITHAHQEILIEPKIEGMEFSCIVLTDEDGKFFALPPTEIKKTIEQEFFDYKQKYMPGQSLQQTPAHCSEENLEKIKEVACKTAYTLGFSNLGRIDGFLDAQERVIITDPNSFSGAAPSSFMFKQAAHVGMNHTQLINHIIKTELRVYGMQDQLESYIKNFSPAEQKKLRVAVIMGGNSREREISLESGRNVVYKLSPLKYEILPLFLDETLNLYTLNAHMLVCNSTQEIAALCMPEFKVAWQDLKKLVDFVFIALHGGQGENGSLQGTLELFEIPYNGSSVFTSALCMNKYKTNQYLKSLGFDVPQHIFISKQEWQQKKEFVIEAILKDISFPCIIKPPDDGCSTLVFKATTPEFLQTSIEYIFAQHKNFVLVEEFIYGMELTGGVIGNQRAQALPPSRSIAHKGILTIEEKFLPGIGENQTPAPLPTIALQLVQTTLEKVYKVINAKGYARIDCFYQTAQESKTGKERVVVLEINTLPALTPATCLFHQAGEVGIKPTEFIDLIIQLGLEEHTVKTQEKLNISIPAEKIITHEL